MLQVDSFKAIWMQRPPTAYLMEMRIWRLISVWLTERWSKKALGNSKHDEERWPCLRTSHSRTYLASSARAMIPAARGAEAEVPVWESVHFCLRSVVIWKRMWGPKSHHRYHKQNPISLEVNVSEILNQEQDMEVLKPSNLVISVFH